MAKIRREEIVTAALEMLNQCGLESLTTRGLAQRLGVESPALYWHFRHKRALLDEMAAHVVMTRHTLPIPEDVETWAEWFAKNATQFRKALLSYRDGARLHAGSKPDARELERIEPKLAYLTKAGIPRNEALMALLAASRFTLGCVLEEQADKERIRSHASEDPARGDDEQLERVVDKFAARHSEAFNFGIALLIDGLQKRIDDGSSRRTLTKQRSRHL